MKQHNKGFTLLELLVTLAIIAIVATIGVPSFQGAMRNSRLTTAINEFSTALNIARSEAIKHNRSVIVLNKLGSGKWEGGWTIFVDADSNGALTGTGDCAAGNDCLLKDHEALPSSLMLRSNNVAFNNSVRYTSSGVSSAGNVSFYLCDNSSSDASKNGKTRILMLNAIGRPAMAVDTNNNGIPEIVAGTDVDIKLSDCTKI